LVAETHQLTIVSLSFGGPLDTKSRHNEVANSI